MSVNPKKFRGGGLLGAGGQGSGFRASGLRLRV